MPGCTCLREKPLDQQSPSDLFWRTAALILWLYLFMIGLLPRSFFEYLRELGAVRTQNALVNSEYLITIGLAAFLCYFAIQRSLEAGLAPRIARAHGVQLGAIGLLAFLPLENGILAMLDGPNQLNRYLVLFAMASKLVAWCYLLSIVVRAYVWGGLAVFRRMNSVFRSVQDEMHPRENQMPPGGASE
jgi:hypothetical protein